MILKYAVGQSLYLWLSSIPTKECLCPATPGMCSHALARLKSAWEPERLRTLNIEATCFARLPQLLQNEVVSNKRPALKHRVQTHRCHFWRNVALCARGGPGARQVGQTSKIGLTTWDASGRRLYVRTKYRSISVKLLGRNRSFSGTNHHYFRRPLWNSVSCGLKYPCLFSDLRPLLRCR